METTSFFAIDEMYKTAFVLSILAVFDFTIKCHTTASTVKNANQDIESTEYYDQLKKQFAETWKKDKVQAIAETIEMMADYYGTFTLVAVENVYNSRYGVIGEVRSISLQIPQKPEEDQYPGRFSGIEDDIHAQKVDYSNGIIPATSTVFLNLQIVRERFVENYFFFDLPTSVTFEYYNKWGTLKRFYYSDSDTRYFHTYDGFAVYNKVVRNADPEVVEQALNVAKDNNYGQVGYLQYDAHKKLVDSQLAPVLQGQLVEHFEATNRMIAEGPRIISQVASDFPKSKIPEQLSVAFTKSFPEYKWRTITNTIYSYISKDLSLTLANHNFDFVGNYNDRQYMVFGIKVNGSG